MDIRTKSPIVLLVILTLVFLAAASVGFYMYHNEHLKNIELEEKIEELSAKYKISEAKFLEAQKVLSSLEDKIKEATGQINDLTNELNKERASKAEAASNLDQIKSDLEEFKQLRVDLENKLSKAQDEVVLMQNKVGALESEKNELEAKVKELGGRSQGVELGKIVVGSDSAKVADKAKNAEEIKKQAGEPLLKKPIEGKVLVVNKEYNFAVINLGSKDGLAMGQVFSVYRGNNYIGDVKVEKLHDSMAAAGFISEDINNKVREGDRVVNKS